MPLYHKIVLFGTTNLLVRKLVLVAPAATNNILVIYLNKDNNHGPGQRTDSGTPHGETDLVLSCRWGLLRRRCTRTKRECQRVFIHSSS